MTKGKNGYVTKEGHLADMLKNIPDLQNEDMPEYTLVEMSPLLDSSNMAVGEWNKIGREIYHRYNDFDGFVILHGTDTMAYTASALSFMLENLDKPVILTGSQIPLFELRSDGKENLITSLLIAAQGIVREVALYFGGSLMRGNRATKMSADELIAFDSPNCPHLAEVGINIRYLKSIGLPEVPKSAKINLVEFKEIPIGVLKVFPGISFSLFDAVMTEKLKGIVLETFGAGNIPESNGALLPIIRRAFNNGSVITVCSQCTKGSVTLGAYETSSYLKAAGAVSGFDMTTESAVAKLYYLFSLDIDKTEIKNLMEKNLRGELTE